MSSRDPQLSPSSEAVSGESVSPAHIPLLARCPREESWPLASIFWEDGQVLRPEHLTTQELTHVSRAGVQALARGVPAYGILAVEWDPQALAQGLLSLRHFMALLPTGEVLALNANTVARSFSLAEVGTTTVDVSLHLLERGQSTTDAPLYHASRSLFGRRFYEVRPAAQAQLSPREGGTRIGTLPLGRFVQQTDGRWMATDEKLPTLLLLGTSPFLLQPLEALRGRLTAYARMGESAMRSRMLSNESVAAIRSYLRRTYRLLATFNNLAHEIWLHPYELYEQLRELYIELSLYHNKTPELAIAPYQHDRLSDCYGPLLKALQALLEAGPGKNVVEFVLENRRYQLKELPKGVTDTRQRQTIYLVVRRAHLSDALDLRALKLTSPRRLQLVHEQALRGLTLVRLDRPPAGAPFEPGAEFLRIELNDEWQYVLSERALAFFEPPGTGEFLAALYWA